MTSSRRVTTAFTGDVTYTYVDAGGDPRFVQPDQADQLVSFPLVETGAKFVAARGTNWPFRGPTWPISET